MGRTEGSYWVQAEWDDEAKCWYTVESNVPGLATGADTIPELVEKLRAMVPSYCN